MPEQQPDIGIGTRFSVNGELWTVCRIYRRSQMIWVSLRNGSKIIDYPAQTLEAAIR